MYIHCWTVCVVLYACHIHVRHTYLLFSIIHIHLYVHATTEKWYKICHEESCRACAKQEWVQPLGRSVNGCVTVNTGDNVKEVCHNLIQVLCVQREGQKGKEHEIKPAGHLCVYLKKD